MSIVTMAQSYKGKVVDSKGEAIPFANVVLYSLPDSTFVTGTTTDEIGNFLIKSKKINKVYIQISCIGYETFIERVKPEVGTVVLKEAINKLGEVIISKSRIKRNAIGYHINLKNVKTAKGKQVSELLTFLPGITKKEGKLKVLGNSVSVVYLNGIKIRNIKELDAIPAKYLQSAQIDYIAGSEEVANAKGAVIHINLKKKNNNGYYGSVGGGFTLMPEYGFTGDNTFVVLNYRYNKLSIYNNLYYNDNKCTGDIDEYKLFKESNYEVSSIIRNRSWEHYLTNRMSLTYDLNKSSEIGICLYADISRGKPKSKYNSVEILNSETSNHETETKTPYKYKLFQITSNYLYRLDKIGSELKFTVDYLHNNENDKTELHKIEPTSSLSKSNSDAITDMLELDAKSKWVFKSKNSLQVGVNYKFIDADYDNLDMLNANEVSKLSGRMPALFAQFSGKKNLLNYRIGMRIQENTIKYTNKKFSLRNKNSDFDLYPSINLMYLLNPEKGNMIMISYKRSIDDIPYSAINPYKKYSSKYFYIVGNPDLVSPKNDVFLAVLNLYNKFTFSTTYYNGHDPIYYETNVDSSDSIISYKTPENGSYERAFATQLEGIFNPTKWWNMKASVQYSLYSIKALSYKEKNQSKFYFSLNNDFTFSKTFGATLIASYDPKCHLRNMTWHSVCDVKGSIFKSFFNNKFETKLSCKLFRKGRLIETEANDIYSSSENKTKEGFFKFSLKYFFNGGKRVKVKRTENIQGYNKIEDLK